MAAILRFAGVMGPLSSLFDLLTFGALLFLFGASAEEFRTAWFLESMATQILVIFVIRTSGRPWRDRPSAALACSSLAALAAALALSLHAGRALVRLPGPAPADAPRHRADHPRLPRGGRDREALGRPPAAPRPPPARRTLICLKAGGAGRLKDGRTAAGAVRHRSGMEASMTTTFDRASEPPNAASSRRSGAVPRPQPAQTGSLAGLGPRAMNLTVRAAEATSPPSRVRRRDRGRSADRQASVRSRGGRHRRGTIPRLRTGAGAVRRAAPAARRVGVALNRGTPV